MNITFETEAVEEKPKFGDVEENQPFIAGDGFLCMKIDGDSLTVIARPDGRPLANYKEEVQAHCEIQRILPRVTKINF